MVKNLNEMTSKELKELAKELKVKSWWTLNKEALITEIEKIQNASEEDKAARDEELRKEDELFEHYSKNWTKYGPKNDWTSFYKDFRAGKITLIDNVSSDEKKEPEANQDVPEETIKETIEEMVGQDSLEEQERDERELVPMPGAEKLEELKKKADPKEKPKKSRGKQIEWNGKSMNLGEWAKELGTIRQTLFARLYIQGWDVDKAFSTPFKTKKKD